MSNVFNFIRNPQMRKGFDSFYGQFGLEPGNTWYVSEDGRDGNDGKTKDTPLLTIAAAFAKVASGDTIYLRGRFTEELTTPASVTDVTIIGASTRPRAGNTAAGPKRGAANWRPKATPAGPLLTVTCQGWRVVNIMFSGASGFPCISTQRDAGSGAAEKNAGHFSAIDCAFWSGLGGIWDTGGANNVHLYNCDFRNMTGEDAFAIKTVTTAIAIPLWWVIENCKFQNNKNHISLDSSEGLVKGCTFTNKGHGVTTVIKLNLSGPLTQGKDNIVTENFFGGVYQTDGDAYKSGTNDEWVGNHVRDINGTPQDTGTHNLVPTT